jgi:hypothetical protein
MLEKTPTSKTPARTSASPASQGMQQTHGLLRRSKRLVLSVGASVGQGGLLADIGVASVREEWLAGSIHCTCRPITAAARSHPLTDWTQCARESPATPRLISNAGPITCNPAMPAAWTELPQRRGDLFVIKQTSKWFVLVAGIFAIGLTQAHAQSPAAGPHPDTAIPIPAGATIWRYDCTGANQCPTRCTEGAIVFLSTSDYASITFVEFPNRSFWLRIDSGNGYQDYLGGMESMLCNFRGAALTVTTTDKPTELKIGK